MPKPDPRDVSALPKKHLRTLEIVLEKPTRSGVRWSAVVALLKRLGAEVDETRAGSSVAFTLRGKTFLLHKPHPGSTLAKPSVERLRAKLAECGVKP